MADRFVRRILDHIADRRYAPSTVRELVHDLAVPEEHAEEFHAAVDQLLTDGQVVLGSADTIALPPPGKTMIGTFRRHEKGFGFLMPDELTEHGDLFIPPGNVGDAMTGDKVKARVIHEKRRGGGGKSPYVGKIVQVIQRSEKQYAGTLIKSGHSNKYGVAIDGRMFAEPVLIRDPDSKNAKVGDKVVIDLTVYPDDRGKQAEGVIIEVLGEAGEPDVETQAVMRSAGLREKFPAEVMEQARQAARKLDDSIPDDREDLTGELICTIDPPDAKDYDDAISIYKRDDGSWELGVHIADVAHYVEPGSALDEEAYLRGNSTYLPRKVVPMLPEVLSNGVCSLMEGVNRFAKSAFMTYDAEGHVTGQRFAKTVIRSAKRLTYLEAQALIEDDIREARRHCKSEAKYPRELIQTLKRMDELAKVIRARRMREGMIVLGLPAVDLVFDESGRVIDAVPEDDAFTHTIIEMFMVEANEAAARAFSAIDVPMIRRVHPDPDAHDIGELQAFARVAGYNIPARPSRKQLQDLLERVRGKPSQHAVHMAVLKTLSKAEYSPTMVGHFALASEHYSHFTSPIRRYPDFVVHRALNALLEIEAEAKAEGKKLKPKRLGDLAKKDPRVPNEDELQKIGRHCSATERNSESAERELRNYLVLELLSTKLGEDFPGTVTGVTGQGVFVQIDRYLVDGFIAVSDLPSGGEGKGDRWQLNRNTGALVAQRSGKSVTIGDTFTVRVANVDLIRRQMELVIIEGSSSGKTSGKPKKSTKPKANGQGKTKSKGKGKPRKTHPMDGEASEQPTRSRRQSRGNSPGTPQNLRLKKHRGKRKRR